jgi:DNA-binding NarL/FixJ family response regulator
MPEGESVRALIADDQRHIADAFRLVLENAGIEVVAVVATGREAINETLRQEPNVVLLDIAMPDLDGFAALTIIKHQYPATTVFMLSSHAEPAYKARAAELGADGFFSKQVDPDHLIQSICTTSAGDAPAEPRDLELEGDSRGTLSGLQFREVQPDTDIHLTEQEDQILHLIAVGEMNEDIARALTISRNTVKAHICHIYEKVGVSNRTEAVLWALRRGFGGIQTYE